MSLVSDLITTLQSITTALTGIVTNVPLAITALTNLNTFLNS